MLHLSHRLVFATDIKVKFLIPKDARVCGRWSVDQTPSAWLAPWAGVGKRGGRSNGFRGSPPCAATNLLFWERA